MMTKPLRLSSFGLAILCAISVQAQTTGLPDPSPEIRRQEQRQEQLRRDLELKPDVQLGDLSSSVDALLPEELPCRQIRAVILDGPKGLESRLMTALAGVAGTDTPLGRCIGVRGIKVLMDRTQNALIAAGYITSRIEAPPQDLNDGTLLLRVVMGRIATMDAASGSVTAKRLYPLEVGSPLRLTDIEQSLENLRRNPSVSVEVQLRPGAQVDTTDVVLNYSQGRPLRFDLSLDDSGSTTTGKLMGQATLSWDNPLGLSDLAYISSGQDLGNRLDGPRGNQSQSIHYSVPWGYWQFSFSASNSQYHQTIAGAFQSYLYSGNTESQEIQVGKVVLRDTHSKTSVQVKGFSRRSKNYIDDTEVEVQRRQTAGWEASLMRLQRMGQVTGDFTLSFKQGTGAFGAIPAPEERFGEGTSNMQIGTLVANVRWPIATRWSGSHYLRMQANSTPLVPQDRLCLGGRHSVRGFDGQQSLCGDRGYLLRNEVVVALDDAVSAYAGLDLGRVGGQSTTELPQRSMSGFAVGLRVQRRIGSDTMFGLDAFAGQPLSKPDFLSTASTTAGFSLNMSF